jgi:hypothetical protein
MIDRDTHCIRRLRFCGRLGNPRLARQRLEAALADDAGVSRPGKEAILCVRRLTLALRQVDKLRETLEAESVGAARPARGPVPANANAVLFADRAELLACLARDWCGGNAVARWWWPVLFPGDDFGAVVRRAWLKDARPVPAAIARLESAGLASQFLTKFSPADVAALWRNIVNTFHLETLDAAWSASEIPGANPTPTPPLRGAAPWSAWITPPASLTKDAARVLITAILLERAPGRIRSLSFAREVRQWDHPNGIRPASRLAVKKIIPSPERASGRKRQPGAPASIASRTLPDPAQPAEDGVVPPGQSIAERPPGRAPSPPRQRRRRSPDSRTHKDGSKGARGGKGDSIASPASPIDVRPPDATTMGDDSAASSNPCGDRSRFADPEKHDPINAPTATTDENFAAPSVALPAVAVPLVGVPPVAVPPVTWPSAAAPDTIATKWGGALYLVNVAIALGLYGDFTTPARTGLALSLWDFLALLGGRLIGEGFAEDPLSRLLARLSGRPEDESPAEQFEPPTGESLAIWLDRICRDVENRIRASLGLGDDCDLRPLVLNHHAKIETDSTRLDAHFSLAKHPIELRLVGLDRDPGWVPAGGRSIYFHYD